MNYDLACDEACRVSKEQSCVQHVNATIMKATIESDPVIKCDGYFLSDWYDGSTVASYSFGYRVDPD